MQDGKRKFVNFVNIIQEESSLFYKFSAKQQSEMESTDGLENDRDDNIQQESPWLRKRRSFDR